MEQMTAILGMLAAKPTEATMIVGTMVFLAAMYFKNRSIDIDQITSVSSKQVENINSLLEQNRKLADDLAHLRTQMAEAHEEILTLRARVAELAAQQLSCDRCPYKPLPVANRMNQP